LLATSCKDLLRSIINKEERKDFSRSLFCLCGRFGWTGLGPLYWPIICGQRLNGQYIMTKCISAIIYWPL